MRKLMVSACAVAFAMAFSAVAGTQVNWFNGGVAADWPEDDSMVGGAWSAVAADAPADLVAGYTAEKGLELDAGDDQLQFTAETAKELGVGTESVTVTSEMQLYPFSEVPETVEDGAKAGVILVSTDGGAHVYGIRKADGQDANEWFQLSNDVVDPEAMAMITIMATPVATAGSAGTIWVKYAIVSGSTVIYPEAVLVKAANTISKASYTGSGFLKSLSSTAVAATTTFTIADLSASGVQATVKSGATWDPVNENYIVAYGDTVVVTYYAADGYVMTPVDKSIAYADVADITVKPDDVNPAVGYFYCAAAEGDKWFTTMDAALAAAPKGSTIVVGAKGAQEAATFSGQGWSISDTPGYGYGDGEGLTIDFNGNTFEFTAGKGGNDPRAIYILKNNKITLKNGTLKAADTWADAEENAFGEFIRSFANGVTLDNMTLDATNMKTSGGRGIQFLNGDVNIINGTMLLKPTTTGVTDFYAIKEGDYAGNYTTGKLTLNTMAGIEGNFLFCGGSAEKVAATLDEGVQFFFGHVKNGLFDPANFTGFGFVAYTGEIATEKAADTEFHTDGQLYTTVADALADATYSPATALANLTADISIPAGKKLVMGAYSVGSAKITLAAEATVESVNQIAITSFTQVSGYTVKETPIVVKEQTVGYSYALEAVPQGTTFTISSTTACEVSVMIAGKSATAPYVAQVGETITFTVSSQDELKVPSRSGKIGNEILVNANFDANGAYSYTVNTDTPVSVNCSFAMIDAGEDDDVEPIDVVPTGTDPDKILVAAINISNLATKGGAVDVALTKKIAGWIKAKSIPGNTIASIGADGAPTTEQFEEAFLLGTAIDAKEIADAKAAFKFPAITPGVVPEVGGTANFNGTVTVQGSNDLKTWDVADGKKFFKATLTK